MQWCRIGTSLQKVSLIRKATQGQVWALQLHSFNESGLSHETSFPQRIISPPTFQKYMMKLHVDVEARIISPEKILSS